jgi:hypothetical protein
VSYVREQEPDLPELRPCRIVRPEGGGPCYIEYEDEAAAQAAPEDLLARWVSRIPEITDAPDPYGGWSREATADTRRIPPENRQDITVREYVDLLNRLENLQRRLSVAASHFLPRYDRDFLPYNYRRLPASLEYQSELLGAPHMEHDLSTRYLSAELLLRSAIHILGADIGPTKPSDPNGYIAGNINWALRPYGLEVVNKKQSDQDEPC